MSRLTRENFLVPTKDLPLLAEGTDVFISNKGRRGPTINGVPGQMVIYDPKDGKALGPSSLNKKDHGQIVIGVIEDTNGDGMADSIRKSFGDVVYGCNIDSYRAKAPNCGLAQVKDLLFKCTRSNTAYGINITVEDENTQRQYPFNKPALYPYTVQVTADGCNDCNEEDYARQIACKFAEAINETVWNQDPTVQGRIMPLDKVEKSFEAVPLWSNEFVFCIDTINNNCGTCAYIPGITGINIEGEDPVAFTFTTVPGDVTKSYQAQLDHIVHSINEALGEFGHAVVTKGAGACCSYQLMINTCKTIQSLTTDGSPIEPCSTSNPLDPVAFEKECKDCGDTDGTVGFVAGIRIISKPVEVPTPCNPWDAINNPIKFYGRHIDIFPSKGWENTSWHKREVQPLLLPNGLGYEFVHREYRSANGGSGRNHDGYDRRQGRLGLPYPNNRANSTRVNCEALYCVYAMQHDIPSWNHNIASGGAITSKGATMILIDKTFSNLIASFEAAMNAYITDGTCGVLEAQECNVTVPNNGEGGEGGEGGGN